VRLSRFVMLLSLLAAPGWAKPWNGITPGLSTSLEILDQFGDASRTLIDKGKSTLVYAGSKAIKGTVQAQFKLDQENVVERIDVYPAVRLDAAAIEKSYGPACGSKGAGETCFVKKEAPSKKPYWVYAKLGLAVFFDATGKTVELLAFIPGS
jgi:hypothetical protein